VALVTYVSAGVHDTMLGSAAILGTAVNVTTGGVSSLGVTAPNLTNKITGCWINIATVPSVSNSGNLTIEIMESGVSKATVTLNYADIKLGFNYARFTTPYQFTTLAAGAYIARVKNTVGTGSLGQLRLATTNLWFEFTYDTAAAVGATDDVWVAGFHNAGFTPKTYTIAGTSNAWGSASAPGASQTTQFMGAGLTIGNGGTFKYDTSANTTLQLKGSIWVGNNGVYDMRGSATRTIFNTLIIDSPSSNGEQGIFTGNTVYGGQVLTTGATCDVYTTYASGLGTAASPMITQTGWDAQVGDEVVIGGATDYLKNETRFIITRNSSTSFVLSTTAGGAEAALTQTHAVGAYMNNLSRNVIIKPQNTTRGWYVNNNSSTAVSSWDYTRMEYSDSSSGKSLTLNANSLSTFDGIVLYQASITGRGCLLLRTEGTAQTHTGITLYNMGGSNFTGQSGISGNATSNKTLNWCFQYNAPSSTFSCALISWGFTSIGNTANNCHSYGGNAVNSAAGYVFGIFSSSANTFNNCTANAARQNAVYFSSAIGNVFNNCSFGGMATNTKDVFAVTGTLNQNYFNTCSFGSATLHSNYLNQLDTSIAKFQNMDTNTSKHRWYTNYGSWWSAGSGLTDTTVRTASSLSLVSKPENATTGSSWTFKVPANPTSQVGIFGYVYRNATFSSGTLKVELFLPGTLLTATPDDTYTFATTTGSWLPFNISAYYSGTDSRYATVRITGVTATAGAYFFIDDLYDAGTGNKVAGLDLWDEGQPSQIMVQSDFSVVPSAVWGYSDANTQASTMGQRQVDGADDAELASIK
jgi:hypothetical protein